MIVEILFTAFIINIRMLYAEMGKILFVPRQMRITFSSLDSIPCRSHEIASEYHITWPQRCLPYATFKNESDLDLQDLIIKIMRS